MLFTVLKDLNFENHEFKHNEIILTNASIFDAYFYCNSKNTLDNKTNVYLPERISHSDKLKYSGHFVFNTNTLLEHLLNSFTHIRITCSNEEIRDFITNKSNNADFDKRFLNIKHYQQFNQKPNTDTLNSIIELFDEFGFNFDNLDYVSVVKLKYTILPKILIISLLNNLYESITLLYSNNVALTYSEKLLKQKFDNITFTLKLFFNDNIIIENNFNIYDINFIVSDFRANLLNIINHYSTFFGPVNLYSYIDFSDEKNNTIACSNDIFSICWYLLISKIQTNFERGKYKKCIDCRKKSVSEKQSNKM